MSESSEALNRIIKGENVFVHGSAGTGKSSLIDGYMDIFGDTTIIVAPTGLAAINVGGVTINSAFKMPTKIPDFKDIKNLKPVRELFGLDSPTTTIVIDEFGMTHSSTMFFMDKTLQKIRKNSDPFGGLQVVMVGDLFQLQPIVKTEDRREYFNLHGYPEPFMYKDWNSLNITTQHLTKVYRQKDEEFSGVLNRLRTGRMTKWDIDYINSRVQSNVDDKPTICMTNKKAEVTNKYMFDQIPSKAKTYKATVSGTFKERPVPMILNLKVGAKVVICVNDQEGGYVNGDVGVITKMQRDYVAVDTERDGLKVVHKRVFTDYKIEHETQNGKLVNKRVPSGHYRQLPLKLFYASTVHKVQGQTLDRVHVDFERGTFCDGQAYVALSRIKTLEGLTLERPLRFSDIKVNKRVVEFCNKIQLN